ncbi:hypothetical protein NMY22_g398 [Coprinellus aureogranulatus]|nr:hypothetical protein NMY22_g398 [Coprinellus aureogranulatus]
MLHNHSISNPGNSASAPQTPKTPTGSSLGRRPRDEEDDVLSSAPRKRPTRTDPLVSHGRHFGRTIHTFCRIFPLVKEGISRELQFKAGELRESDLSEQEHRERRIYLDLLRLVPGLSDRLLNSSEHEIHYVADMLSKGSLGARADDTKSLKSVIIDWITPPGGSLHPPLSRNVKTDRGFFHNATGELLCPATLDWADEEIQKQLKAGEIVVSGDNWPIFLYRDHTVNLDNPWEGLFQGTLLVSAYKHVFTCPSSVEQETRATRSGNAELHGMKSVTIASLAYIATLARFALGSSAVFSRNDKTTDSERFYRSIIAFLESPSEKKEVDELLKWWNVRVFPSWHSESGPGKKALFSIQDRLKDWRVIQNSPSGSRNMNAFSTGAGV